ncbi:hypothetical protein EYZ11_001439 [Aspergillus tanneri]|uniref:Mediator of RNA polymerase II transcription subunit 19 n=1 Tax=Aspergillus tanneri TaxID=1220188 RepID=A0A4S3JUH3_9EURO|nr:hypothetical protein EYZ11_001439 [Aspergillus tanneri]
MSDRAASFRLAPPSPSSPATGSLKESQPAVINSEPTPQTPTSPPLMSVGAPNYASNFTSSQASPSQAMSQPANLSSPPSSAPMSTQASQQPTVGATNSFPTPASSVSGHFMAAMSVDDPEHADKSFGGGPPPAVQGSSSTPQAEHRRTDHDRNPGDLGMETGVRDFANMGDQNLSSHGDAMDIDKETIAPSNADDFSLDSLQKEFASAYHLCKSSHIVTGPDPSLDLVSLYGLGPVAKSVARMDPVTGEKINRLRKSYEGKLKGLGLAGRNKPVKHDSNTPGGLLTLTQWPEEEWQNQKVYGKPIKIADMDSELQKLQKAMHMEPGTLPDNEYWEDVLGHEKPSKHASSGDAGKKTATPTNGVRATVQSNGTPAAAESERARPSRGRKRHYDDNSFVGYGEGYADDDDDGAFYSNNEGAGKKKRKKVRHLLEA